MSQTSNSGPAFPGTDAKGFVSDGMSLRDYFAGHAWAGMVANPEIPTDAEYITKWSYLNADAMLAERQKERE